MIAEQLQQAEDTARHFGAVFAATRDVEGFARVVYLLERLFRRPIVLVCEDKDETLFSQSCAARVAQLWQSPPLPLGAPPGPSPFPPDVLALVASLQSVQEYWRARHKGKPRDLIARWFKPITLPTEKTIGEKGETILELQIPRRGKRNIRRA